MVTQEDEKTMLCASFIYAHEVYCKSIENYYPKQERDTNKVDPDKVAPKKVIDKFENNIQRLLGRIDILHKRDDVSNEHKKAIKDYKDECEKPGTEANRYTAFFQCLRKIICNYRNYMAHVGHKDTKLYLGSADHNKYKGYNEYKKVIDILEIFYIYEIEKAFNENVVIKERYSKEKGGICPFTSFYEGEGKKLSRDAKIFILSFILPKHRFTELISSCRGYKHSKKHNDGTDNQPRKSKKEQTPFYEKREQISKFSMPSYDVFLDTLPQEIHLYLKCMSTASKIPAEYKEHYIDKSEKGTENTYNVQNVDTFTQYAVRFIEDQKLFSKIKFVRRHRAEDGRKIVQQIQTKEGALLVVKNVSTQNNKDNKDDSFFPYYIDNGNVFCCVGEEKEEGGILPEITFKLSTEHLSHIIQYYFICKGEDSLDMLHKHCTSNSCKDKNDDISKSIDALKPSEEEEKILFNLESNIIENITQQIHEKEERNKKSQQKEYSIITIEERVSRKIEGIQKKFATLCTSTPKKDYDYIVEIIQLIYLLADTRTVPIVHAGNPIAKEQSIALWQNIFLSIQQGYTKEAFIEMLKNQDVHNNETESGGLYSGAVKTLCDALQDNTHKDLLRACKKVIDSVGKKDIGTLKNGTNEEKLAIANKYKCVVEQNPFPHNFTISSFNFALDLRKIRCNYKKNTEDAHLEKIFWGNAKKKLDEKWYTKLFYPLEFLFQDNEYQKIRKPKDIQETDAKINDRNKLSKARKTVLERGWHAFLLQKIADVYYTIYSSSIIDGRDAIKIERCIRDISDTGTRFLLGVTIIGKKEEKDIKITIHPTDFLQYFYIIGDLQYYRKHLNKDLKKFYEKNKGAENTREELLEIARLRKQYFKEWLLLLVKVEEYMVREIGQHKKRNPNFRALVEKYNTQHNNITEENKEYLIAIRNMVFHEDPKDPEDQKDPEDPKNNGKEYRDIGRQYDEVEGFIREIATKIGCAHSPLLQEKAEKNPTKKNLKHTRSNKGKKRDVMGNKKENGDSRKPIDPHKRLEIYYKKLADNKQFTIKRK